MERLISGLKGHYIVCGIGGVGKHIIYELHKTGRPFVALDKSEEVCGQLGEKGILFILGDATSSMILRAANAKRQKRLAEELACMRPLPAGRLAEYRELEPLVSSQSLIRVKKHAYSVPSRLIGHTLRVQLYEAHLKVFLGREYLFDLPRLRGDRGALVDFRHVIIPLLRSCPVTGS